MTEGLGLVGYGFFGFILRGVGVRVGMGDAVEGSGAATRGLRPVLAYPCGNAAVLAQVAQHLRQCQHHTHESKETRLDVVMG